MRRLSVAVAAIALAAVLSPAAARTSTHEVAAAGGPFGPTWRWDPAAVDAARKDRVVWRNPTSTTHHVTFYGGPLEGKTLHVPAGGSAKLRLKKAGSYPYRCDIQGHSELVGGLCIGQCGEITVE
jgi:plastocyanin